LRKSRRLPATHVIRVCQDPSRKIGCQVAVLCSKWPLIHCLWWEHHRRRLTEIMLCHSWNRWTERGLTWIVEILMSEEKS
jgi:hypothetical protein